MIQHPKKAAENASLLGAWRQPSTNVCTPIQSRRAWHKARREGRLGEQVTHAFEKKYTVADSKKAAARMKASIS